MVTQMVGASSVDLNLIVPTLISREDYFNSGGIVIRIGPGELDGATLFPEPVGVGTDGVIRVALTEQTPSSAGVVRHR